MDCASASVPGARAPVGLGLAARPPARDPDPYRFTCDVATREVQPRDRPFVAAPGPDNLDASPLEHCRRTLRRSLAERNFRSAFRPPCGFPARRSRQSGCAHRSPDGWYRHRSHGRRAPWRAARRRSAAARSNWRRGGQGQVTLHSALAILPPGPSPFPSRSTAWVGWLAASSRGEGGRINRGCVAAD